MTAEPVTDFDARYSDAAARALPWEDGRHVLETAELYWISTVRPDGRPHLTPLVGVWTEGAMYFVTGPEERKGRNLAANPEVVLNTGSNRLHEGLDVAVEGTAVRITDPEHLQRVADAYVAKYGEEWHFRVDGDAFRQDGVGSPGYVYRVRPRAVRGFAKDPYGQTCWRFS